MREILADFFTWPWFSEPHGYNFNGHFIRHARLRSSSRSSRSKRSNR
jgi:hypothetical protein